MIDLFLPRGKNLSGDCDLKNRVLASFTFKGRKGEKMSAGVVIGKKKKKAQGRFSFLMFWEEKRKGIRPVGIAKQKKKKNFGGGQCVFHPG